MIPTREGATEQIDSYPDLRLSGRMLIEEDSGPRDHVLIATDHAAYDRAWMGRNAASIVAHIGRSSFSTKG